MMDRVSGQENMYSSKVMGHFQWRGPFEQTRQKSITHPRERLPAVQLAAVAPVDADNHEQDT